MNKKNANKIFFLRNKTSYYLKLAWRNLIKRGHYGWLNIAGLSFGLCITILLFMYISNELSFDSMYKSEKNIYRILLHTNAKYNNEIWCNVPNAVAPTMTADIPGVAYAARLVKYNFGEDASVSYGEKSLVEKNFYFGDSDILKIFNLTFLAGNSQNALIKPNSVIISKSTAIKLFGNDDPMGKPILIGSGINLEVTGVFRDILPNSTLDCNILANYRSGYFGDEVSWSDASFETYCLLNPRSNVSDVEKKLKVIVGKNTTKETNWYWLSLQPLKDVHLYSRDYKYTYSSRSGDIAEIKELIVLALLVLLIGSINYVNLATARSQDQAKEVGVHKTYGASFRDLLLRIYIETSFTTIFSFIIGVGLAIAVIPFFDDITGKLINFRTLLSIPLFISLAGLWIALTLLAGFYPAISYANLPPFRIFQQRVHAKSLAGFFRKALVVIQFSASGVLIIIVLVIHKQLQFAQHKKLGYEPENVMAISTAGAQKIGQILNIVNELKAQSNVISVCRMQGFPGKEVSKRTLLKTTEDGHGISINTNAVGNGSVAKTLQIKVLAGEDLPELKSPGDTIVDVLLNKTAVSYLGYTPEQAIGKKVNIGLGENTYVKGVVSDFNFESLHSPIEAYAFHDSKNAEGKQYVVVRFRTKDLSQVILEFEKIYKSNIPNTAFDFNFLDSYLKTFYLNDRISSRIIFLFSLFAVLIACLGLFGLSSFTSEQRSKEIGVRKVLGASITKIIFLLVNNFLRLVAIGFMIACPIGWILGNKWLNNFAFRISFPYQIFIETGFILLTIAFITVAVQSFRAASIKPAESLKRE